MPLSRYAPQDVMPPLLAALKELKRIDKGSIAELKSMKNPPTGTFLSVQGYTTASRQ